MGGNRYKLRKVLMTSSLILKRHQNSTAKSWKVFDAKYLTKRYVVYRKSAIVSFEIKRLKTGLSFFSMVTNS